MPYRKVNLKAFVDSLSPDQRADLIQMIASETGSAGGRARAAKMTPEQRREHAMKMVEARRAKGN